MQSQNPAKRQYFELAPTFFNRNLLDIDPFQLRDELFGGRLESANWQLIENLLLVIEDEAEKIWPNSDLYIDGPEDVFWNRYGNLKLNHREANAVSALRSIAVIRRLYALDPWEHSYNSPTVARIALEVMTLIMTAIRGDFLGEYIKFIERGAAAFQGSKSKKEDRLNKAILKELQLRGVGRSAIQILADVEASIPEDNANIAEEIIWNIGDDNSVDWFDERHRTRNTSFKSFQNRVSKLKKRLKP